MGVYGIKNSILEQAQNNVPRKFDYVVVDGSNVLCNFMRKVRCDYINHKRKIRPWNNVNYDLVTTIRMFVSDVCDLMEEYLLFLESITDCQIMLVFDLIENRGKKQIKVDESQINSIYDNVQTSNDSLNIQINEQNNAHIFQPDNKFDKSIESLDLNNYEHEVISEVYQQTSLLNNISNVIVFQNFIIYSVFSELDKDKTSIIRALDSADFVIKRLVDDISNDNNLNNSNKNILVISNDNDFYFMLYEYKNVFIAPCNEDLTTVRSPFYAFEEMGFVDIHEIIRTSAFLGNDFTNHKSIMKNVSLNNVAKMLKNYDVETIDSYIIKHTSEEYAKGYIKSILIYESWESYGVYEIKNGVSVNDINEELKKALNHIYEEYIQNKYLIKWRYSPFRSRRWEYKFFDYRNFDFVYFNNSDDFIKYVIGRR